MPRQTGIGKRRRADRRELALPDLALVHERTVRVAREGDRVREGLQHGKHAAAVRPPAAVAGRALDRQVLEVEERLAGVAQALRVGHEECRRVGTVLALVVGRVFRRDEIVPLHGPEAHRRVLLAEHPFPLGLHAALGLHRRFVLGMARGVHVHRHVTVPPALEVVVARAEERNGLGAVEHALPRVAHVLPRVDRAPVGDVAAHHHGIRTARLEETERLLVARLRTGRGHMDVAHHAECQRRTPEKIHRAAARHERRGQPRKNEFTPTHTERRQVGIFCFHHAGQYTISRRATQGARHRLSRPRTRRACVAKARRGSAAYASSVRRPRPSGVSPRR